MVLVRLAGSQIQDGLEDIRSAWNNLDIAAPLQYSFLDDRIDQQYREEQNTARVIGFFAGLSILIACMGLFGMAAFTAEQRMKEIGIRKVMGATVKNIIMLLYRDFSKLLLAGAVLAAPVIYYVAGQWLADFPYRIDIGPSAFLSALAVVILLALVATGGRSLQAALMNPVDAIRDE